MDSSRHGGRPGARSRMLIAVATALVGVFVVSVAIRAPWRGHLAKGDQWVSALALRWVRAWHRDGAWASRFALVESPPTAEFAGERAVHKWSLPGQILLLHALHEPFGLEPSVATLQRVNLGLHLITAWALALLAFLLARQLWPGRDGRAALVALHCGSFVLLFPALLYWGQNVSCQDFTILPLLAFIVGARWLRASVAPGRARLALDAGVAMSVLFGTITEYLFLVLVPYLVVERLLAARTGRPRTSDPWPWTLVVPFVLGLGFLGIVSVANGQLAVVRWRLGTWTLGGAEQPGLGFVGVRVALFFMFLAGHYADAWGPIGLGCLAFAVVRVLPRRRAGDLPPAVRGILLDLLLPCLLFTLLLAHHQAFHTISAVKYAPFVALTWTVLVPFAIACSSGTRRTVLAVVYGVVAALAILPFSSNYRALFPAPEPDWDREAAFVRTNTRPDDVVVSPITAIDLVPPQRIALTERRVLQAYGLLDVAEQTAGRADDAIVAVYGPCRLAAAFGAGVADTVARDGDACIARVGVGRIRALLAARPDAAFLAHLGDVLRGELETAEHAARPFDGVVRPPRPPVAIHATDAARAVTGGWDRLYWADAQRWHWRAFAEHGVPREWIVLDDRRFATDWMGLWRRVPAVDGAPLAWGTFVRDVFVQAAARAQSGDAQAFAWHGYDVVRVAIDEPPAVLRARAPAAVGWTAYAVVQGGTPVGAALGPLGSAAAGSAAPGSAAPGWVAVAFDDLLTAVAVPDYVSTDWTVRHDHDDGG